MAPHEQQAPGIEDLALLSDTETAALVDNRGVVRWLCLPRFDSGAIFASLLGDDDNGLWRLAPTERSSVRRRYRAGLVLETVFSTDAGEVAVIDFMPVRDAQPNLVRIVVGRSGRVRMEMDLRLRMDYGSIVPWVRSVDHSLIAVAGPDKVRVATPVEMHGEDMHTVADFEVEAGDRVPFVFEWCPSHQDLSMPIDAEGALEVTTQYWEEWLDRCDHDSGWNDAVRHSLAVLKGLTYQPTGGIVAAPTTSLPEAIGGERNWDYRFCWLRDATLTLIALLDAGYTDEALSWRDWLLRAVAGDPHTLQIMYGLAGERRLPELVLPWLDGYEDSGPVRIGNGAHTQHQLDVFGEVMDALHQARQAGLPTDENAWNVQRALIDVLAERWTEPDEGIWEMRGGRRHFTHSKVMAWVAVDRMIRGVQDHGLEGPVDRWRKLRDEIHADACENGVVDGVFRQSYGDKALDASLLMIPLVGFLPADDERVVATVDAIADDLCDDGYVLRYRPDPEVEGLHCDEGAFLLCSFWLADCYALMGRHDEAVELFERLLDLRNDVGLLSEEVDAGSGRLLGNFPQAFSHIAIVNTATNLCESARSRMEDRAVAASDADPGSRR